MRKNFSKALYEANDSKGKTAGIELFKQKFGLKHVELTQELYQKGDLVFVDCDGQGFTVEVEIKNVGWKDGKFKYDTLDFAYKPNNEADYFVSFNKTVDRAYVCLKENLIKEENIVFKNTRNRFTNEKTEAEPFYRIKVSDCELYHMEDKIWKEKQQ